MSDIKEVAKRLFARKEDYEAMDKYARNKFDEHFKNDIVKYGWRGYDSFELKNENTLTITFKYGAGDFEYTDYLDIKIE